jgi:hypothetical protein
VTGRFSRAEASCRFRVDRSGHTSRSKRVDPMKKARRMIAFAVVLLVLAVVLIVLGLVLYGNGIGTVPDDVGGDPKAARRGMTRISSKELLGRMKTSVRGMRDAEADRDQKLTATGSFCVLVGLVLVVIAVLALIAGLA